MPQYPLPPRHARKGENGRVAVIGGSPEIHGAPVLAAQGALAAGSDLVWLFLPDHHVEVARQHELNLFVSGFGDGSFSAAAGEAIARKCTDLADAVAFGCGFLEGEREAVKAFLRAYAGLLVLDAGALFADMLPLVRQRQNVLLTPHAGEFRRLFGCEPDPQAVRTAAKEHGVTILCKGKTDMIASADEYDENETGNALMTVGGTGDCLAGICAGLMARGLHPFAAACLAASRWGRAGDRLAKKYAVIGTTDLLKAFRRR
jgi:NAD(P)H-hydrate epimerase